MSKLKSEEMLSCADNFYSADSPGVPRVRHCPRALPRLLLRRRDRAPRHRWAQQEDGGRHQRPILKPGRSRVHSVNDDALEHHAPAANVSVHAAGPHGQARALRRAHQGAPERKHPPVAATNWAEPSWTTSHGGFELL